MDSITILGLIAALLTTISFVPQIIKIYKLKDTKDISLEMYIIISCGLFLWLIYGILINSIPIIVANTFSFIFTLTIIFFKIKYK